MKHIQTVNAPTLQATKTAVAVASARHPASPHARLLVLLAIRFVKARNNY